MDADAINAAVQPEGWAIFNTLGTQDDGDWRIERDDEAGVFDDDMAAWNHILSRAQAGSVVHRKALSFIRAHNETEWELICTHYGTLFPLVDVEKLATAGDGAVL